MDIEDDIYVALSRFAPDVVVHLAAYAKTHDTPDPMEYWQNVQMTKRLLEDMDTAGCRKLLFASSCSVYGWKNVPVREFEATEPTSDYGKSKLCCEWMISSMCNAKKLCAITFRYANVTGAYGRIGVGSESGCLIPKAVQCALQHETFEIAGDDWPSVDGTPVVDIVHVEDVANLNVQAVEKLLESQPGQYMVRNVCTGEFFTVQEILNRVMQRCGKFPVKVGPARPGEAHCLMSCYEVKADDLPGQFVFGFHPKNCIDITIMSQLKWMKVMGKVLSAGDKALSD
jgi:UDP-glucose 4-epimerase